MGRQFQMSSLTVFHGGDMALSDDLILRLALILFVWIVIGSLFYILK